MQVSIEAGEGLKRIMSVQVPADGLDERVEERLKSMVKTVKIDGFRPGKVPLKVVRQRYAESVEQEEVSTIMQRAYYDAIQKEDIQVAGYPQIEAGEFKKGEDLTFTANFEVYPEFELAELSEL